MNIFAATGYGVDVGVSRADDLDKKLLALVVGKAGVRVLDIGCGAGGVAARLQAIGAEMVGVDRFDFAPAWQSIGEFHHGDVRDLKSMLPGAHFDYCLCQRMLHYVPHADAVSVLSHLRQIIDNQLYISFSGLTSALAPGYQVASVPIEQRHGFLGTEQQQTFGITTPITLYREAEAIALLEQGGWQVDWVRTSDFGNIKIIATPNQSLIY